MMSDADFHDGGEVIPRRKSSLNTPVNLVGATLSVGLIMGLSVWSYQLVMRDVTGVPVVRALDTPMRSRPEAPGGQPAAYQGLAVNQVPAEGIAGPAPDQVALAPQADGITDADAPATMQAKIAAAAPKTAPKAEPEQPKPASMASATDLAVAAALAEVAQDTAESAELLAGEEVTGAPQADGLPADVLPASLGGIVRSPRPEPRPRVQVASAAPLTTLGPSQDLSSDGALAQPEVLTRASLTVARDTAPAQTPARPLQNAVLDPAIEAKVSELDPAAIASGTRLVQLGAYDSAEEAKIEWGRLTAPFDSQFADKQRVIQEAASGGRTFYRLRVAGFADLSEARRFCTVLLAEDAPCIPVVAR